MNSIKNAIVTVTLLVVGYGSYLVLQDPPEDGSFQELSADNINQPSPAQRPSTISSRDSNVTPPSSDLDLKIEIEGAPEPTTSFVDAALANAHPLQTIVPDSTAVTDMPATPRHPALPEVPDPPADLEHFAGERGITETLVETPVAPPVANFSIPPEDVFEGSPHEPNPNTGPFSAPIVVAVSPADVSTAPAPGLEATDEYSIPKIDTASVGTVADMNLPAINESFGPIPPSGSAEGSSAFEQAWMTVQQQLRDQDLVQAISTLSPWASDSSLSKDQQGRCLQLLDQLAGSVIYSRDHHLEPEYPVQAGETLDEIASRYNVPQDLLARINGIAPPYALTTGEILKVVRGPFRAEIGLFKSELTLYVGSTYAGRFPVTIGPDLPPEEAFYEVAEKSNGRHYFDRRSGNEVLRGDESNRYGNHWLGLRGEHITTGHSVGIHGRPTKFASDNVGSISLDPLDAEDVFSILSVGSRVHVRK